MKYGIKPDLANELLSQPLFFSSFLLKAHLVWEPECHNYRPQFKSIKGGDVLNHHKLDK
jgi:hypothetical protein